MKHGIEETKDLVKALLSMASATAAAKANDGKINLQDMALLVMPMTSLPAALTGLDQVPSELMDLDAEEKVELLEFAKKEFDLPSDDVEKLVERALTIGLGLFELVRDMLKK